MNFIRINLLSVLIITFALIGCASPPQKEIGLISQYISGASGKIGVITTKLPDVEVTFPGADCLLCVGVAMAAHSSLRDHAVNLKGSELRDLNNSIISRLNSKGLQAVNLGNQLEINKLETVKDLKDGYSKKDFSGYQKEGFSALIIIHYKELGFKRGYQNYFPIEPPKASLIAEAYMVQVSDNKLNWYTSINLSKGVVGDWDVPPRFPQLTNSYYSLVEEFKDKIADTFK